MFEAAIILFLLGLLAFSRAQTVDLRWDMADPRPGFRWRVMGTVLIAAALWVAVFLGG